METSEALLPAQVKKEMFARCREQTDRVTANHIATKPEPDGRVIRYAEPGRMAYAIQARIDGRHLFLWGDLGAYVFWWPGSTPLTWAFIHSCDYDYFLSKCEASADGRQPRAWTEEMAEARIREHLVVPWEKWVEAAGEDSQCGSPSLFSEAEWCGWLNAEAGTLPIENYFGHDWWEFLFGIGWGPHHSLVRAWMMLRDAIVKLDLHKEE